MNSGKADAPAGDESIHLVTIDWTRGKWSGTRGKYSREHQWHFAGRLSLKVSDALALLALGRFAPRWTLLRMPAVMMGHWRRSVIEKVTSKHLSTL